MMDEMGIETGIDIVLLIELARKVRQMVGHDILLHLY